MDIIDDAAEYLHTDHGDPAPAENGLYYSRKSWRAVAKLSRHQAQAQRNPKSVNQYPYQAWPPLVKTLSASVLIDCKWAATLTALTGIITLCCFIPIYLAWSSSDYVSGSAKDADFWWLIQSSMMQMLSLLTLSVPIWQGSRLPSQNWFWTWLFIGVATVATFLAVPLYLYIPVAYSSTLVFVVTAAQAFVVLQLGLAAGVAMGQGNKEKTQ